MADLQSELSAKGDYSADDITCTFMPNLMTLSILKRHALNSAKTKFMMTSLQARSAKHSLEGFRLEIHIKGKKLDTTDACKLLGVHFNHHLMWDLWGWLRHTSFYSQEVEEDGTPQSAKAAG